MIRSKILILTAVLLLNPAFSFAQAGDTALKAKAYELLETLATQTSTLQSAENRARMGSNIAWSLWPHDETRARAIFAAVGQDIRLGWQPREDKESENVPTLTVFLQLRTDTIDRIAKYDPEFAFDFLKTTEPPYEQMPPNARERERALVLRLAKQVVDSNPDLALKLGRVALAHGFSEELLTFLRPLLRKHRKQGALLYKEIVAKVRNAKLTDDYRVIAFVSNLVRITPPVADETAYGELTNFLLASARALKCDQEHSEESEAIYICNRLAPLMGRGAKLQILVPDSETSSSDEVYAEIEELAQAGDYEGFFKLAEKAPSFKLNIYWRAFNLARTTGDLERGEKIAAAYDGLPSDKERMLEMVEHARDAATLSEAEVQEIQRKLATLTDPRRRADYLIETALRIGVNNRTLAVKLLDQVVELAEARNPGSDRTETLVGLAMLYCMEKSDRGFSLMESQMPVLNGLIDAAVKLDGFDTHYVREGEWNMSAAGSLGELLTFMSKNAAYFAWCDFDRAVSLAAQFERPEIRMMAQLKLAQGILAGPPKRLRMNWGGF